MNILKRIASGEAERSLTSKHVAIAIIESSHPSPTEVRSSLPIPISSSKTACLESYEIREQEMQAEKYDLATWNIYLRIVCARSLRTANRTEEDESAQSSVNARPRSVSFTEASEEHSQHKPTDLDQLFEDECYSDTF
ncbi:hypothetical protein ACHAWO_000623 [Cyclotella atomus]|uniref:Uncharacterized protein n=1 Tax=Cyclotella atomus TaxID=382360 RepID=A0ABD3NAA0_9STRA